MEVQKFYNSNMAKALEEATQFGSVPTLPELIDMRIKAPFTDLVWQYGYDTTTEEHVGTSKGKAYVVIVHGQGLLTAQRIQKSLDEGLHEYSAKITQSEFDNLLKGKINGKKVAVYTASQLAEIKGNAKERNYVVVLTLAQATEVESGYRSHAEIEKSVLALCRMGGNARLKAYLAKIKEKGYSNLGCYYRYVNKAEKYTVPSARLLFLDCDGVGVLGDLLGDLGGRFLGVRNESRAPKNGVQKETSEDVRTLIASLEARINALESKFSAVKEALQ